MFHKFDINISDLDLDRIKGPRTKAFGKTFIESPIKDRVYLQQYMQTKIKFGIQPNNVLITEILSPGANPHCDRWKTALNFYFDAGDDVTYFFKEKNPSITGWGHQGLKLYNIETLEVTDTFTANEGECYLLNVHKIHCIKMSAPDKTRTMLRFTWDNDDFDAVKSSIEILK